MTQSEEILYISKDMLPSARSQRESLGILNMLSNLLIFLGETALLSFQCLKSLVTGRVAMRDVLTQMASVGADSIWIVLANNFFTGAVFSIYTATLAVEIGFPDFVGGTVGYAFLNELGPMLAGVSLASRAGAAIAAEIGTMVVTEQVDALRAMAISPIRYLVAPRVIASMCMLPLLTVLADVFGMIGAMLAARSYGVGSIVFWESVHKFTQPVDLWRGLIKSVVFGLLIGTVSCQQGLRTEGGATGVGKATTSSVVCCVVLIFLSDFFLAQILTQFFQRHL